ncbi:bifunctional folylpolyglutamate synthase/dihydrofolate synthase [Reticulibacter mediterranei]|uniref:tetrahydrofolate synthase n=2 Tax=Reticulibacter mediterranei TaxID=2778369 RepID=A0A8J3N1S7_9CHLR|nr:bifunctional folylpolyglutamate synthase/dihydrofolate synthase [Reticulibacter mediterranei]
MMNYQEALAYIYSFIDYERSGKYTRDRNENLEREKALLDQLGNPQQKYSNTLIAGTKGKGSTAALIERVLREAGISTGLYTQPDLHTFRERAQVNGRMISEEEVAELVPDLRAAVEQIQSWHKFEPFITYEVGTALALLYFARQQVQHAVVEVGLGGRLDATNVTHPLVSVIASISYDHMSILGNTLDKIATEKAGIIKQNGPVVTSARPPEALLAIARVAQQRAARMVRVGPSDDDPAQAEVDAGKLPPLSYRYRLEERHGQQQRFTVWTPERVYNGLEIPLAGEHQIENATLALATLDMLRERGISWDEQALRRGLALVHWPARIEVVGQNPTIVVDGAHNADSMQKLVQALRSSFDMHRLIVVLGTNKDKDQGGIARELAEADAVVLTKIHNPRTTAIETLESAFVEHAPDVIRYMASDLEEAMALALDLADNNDLICVTGSVYLAGEALRWAAAHGSATAAAEIGGVDH